VSRIPDGKSNEFDAGDLNSLIQRLGAAGWLEGWNGVRHGRGCDSLFRSWGKKNVCVI
jgi:hypothetical protein